MKMDGYDILSSLEIYPTHLIEQEQRRLDE
jgi:hypothetical protein